MKKLVFLFSMVTIIMGLVFTAPAFAEKGGEGINKPVTTQFAETYFKLPLHFIKNEGQLDGNIRFYEKGIGQSISFTKDGIYIALTRDDTTRIIKLCALNGTEEPVISGERVLEGKINSFIGKNKEKWKTNIPTYGAVRYENVYENVDIKFYGNKGQLEYDIILKEGADPSLLKFSYEGIDKLTVTDEGNLQAEINGDQLIHKKPYIYQEINGERRQIPGTFHIYDQSTFGFQVATYDRNHPVIIDPILEFSSYLGGNHNDLGYDIAVDATGNVYVTGTTDSPDFPTYSALQPELAPFYDVFVTKISPSGTSIIYSTYLGGTDCDSGTSCSGYEIGRDIEVDSMGNVYLAGTTDAVDFPVQNAIQPIFGGDRDAFVVKINPTGDALVYSTYIGGLYQEIGYGMTIDSSGNVYVAGVTSSLDFPVQNAIQPYRNGNFSDAFVTKINPAGDALVFSTYLGGTNSDEAYDIEVDDAGNIYFYGHSTSLDFPTQNALQPNNAGGQDLFIAKMNPAGDALIYSTYLGGNGSDWASRLALDGGGNVYITGDTSSSDFPVMNAIQPNSSDPDYIVEAFVSKINATGDALVYSTYLGGSQGVSRGNDLGDNIAVDSSGYVYVSGSTTSSDFPVYGEPVATFMSGRSNAFLTMINPSGTVISYSTYLGATYGYGLAIDDSDNVYLTGSSGDYLPIVNAFQPFRPGYGNAYVMKISVGDIDYDIDSYPKATDCNDDDAEVNPGIDEKGKLCKDGVDNDCDGLIDRDDTSCGGGGH